MLLFRTDRVSKRQFVAYSTVLVSWDDVPIYSAGELAARSEITFGKDGMTLSPIASANPSLVVDTKLENWGTVEARAIAYTNSERELNMARLTVIEHNYTGNTSVALAEQSTGFTPTDLDGGTF